MARSMVGANTSMIDRLRTHRSENLGAGSVGLRAPNMRDIGIVVTDAASPTSPRAPEDSTNFSPPQVQMVRGQSRSPKSESAWASHPNMDLDEDAHVQLPSAEEARHSGLHAFRDGTRSMLSRDDSASS